MTNLERKIVADMAFLLRAWLEGGNCQQVATAFAREVLAKEAA